MLVTCQSEPEVYALTSRSLGGPHFENHCSTVGSRRSRSWLGYYRIRATLHRLLDVYRDGAPRHSHAKPAVPVFGVLSTVLKRDEAQTRAVVSKRVGHLRRECSFQRMVTP